MRSLANHCLDLRFRRPSPAETTTAMRRVVADQGYKIDEATMNRIAQSCNADIRQMLNLLQMWRPEGGQALSSAEVTQRLETAFKDIDVGPFDVADKFFREPNASLEKRLRHYFVDSSMTPLMVQVRPRRTSAKYRLPLSSWPTEPDSSDDQLHVFPRLSHRRIAT